MAYNDQQVYAKYLQKKCLEESSCTCEKECSCSKDDCGCCPVGLVALEDADGKYIACVTPQDAETYITNLKEICKPGFAALYKDGSPDVFLGCVSEANYAELYAIVNPA